MKSADTHLFWYYRLAKFELAAERRALGRLGVAEYEQNLPHRLQQLTLSGLSPETIFRSIDPGRIWVRPKGVDRPKPRSKSGSMVTIPEPAHDHQISRISVRILLEPTPDFAICEALWLRTFGPALELMLTNSCMANRLDLRGEPPAIPIGGRRLFRYWGQAYRRFRAEGTRVARELLQAGQRCILAVLDLTSYYDNIDPSFLLSADFVDAVAARARARSITFDRSDYVAATTGLLASFTRTRDKIFAETGVKTNIGIPIGSLASRIVANLALSELDRHIASLPAIRHYARYVDDIVAVAIEHDNAAVPLNELISRFAPLDRKRSSNKTLTLDAAHFKRPGSNFEVQLEKLRVFRLKGDQGLEYLSSIESEMARMSSERRRFLEPWGTEIDHTVAASPQSEPIHALREADALSLRRYAVGTVCDKVFVASAMLERKEARDFSREYLGKAGRLATDWSRWVEFIDVALRILGAALVSDDGETAHEIVEALLERVESLHAGKGRRRIRIRWGDKFLPVKKARKLLRAWVETQLTEALCSASAFNENGFTLHGVRALESGIGRSSHAISPSALLDFARTLAQADLRLHDAESDLAIGSIRPARERTTLDELIRELGSDPTFAARSPHIDEFIDACAKQGDPVYAGGTPVDLLLSPRPPTFEDVLFRWLRGGKPVDKLLTIVNAVRGTRYFIPPMELEDRTIRVAPPNQPSHAYRAPVSTRVVLGNLCTDDDWWEASLTGPAHTVERQHRLARIVNQAMEAAARAWRNNTPTLLVLPELSLPRAWLRGVLHHLSQHEPTLGLVAGLEYDVIGNRVYNEAIAFLPRPYHSAAGWIWTKRRPAHHEGPNLKACGNFQLAARGEDRRFHVMSSEHGDFIPLICSELLEVDTRSELLGRVDIILVPAWNQDTRSFEYFVHSSTLELHSFVAVANNGQFSDCRARGPFGDDWRRDTCRLLVRGENETVVTDFPLALLREYRRDPKNYTDRRKKWIEVAARSGINEAQCPWLSWKPMPPGMRT